MSMHDEIETLRDSILDHNSNKDRDPHERHELSRRVSAMSAEELAEERRRLSAGSYE